MSRNDWISILYVSISIVIWGTVGSLIDYVFLQNELYEVGSFGQFITFFITGALISIAAILLSKNLNNNTKIDG